MKTKITFSVLLLFGFCHLSSQVPQGFNYQAIARDATGKSIINTSLPVTITIQSDSLGGTIYWKELHSSAQSNGLGVLTLVIGKGTRQTGSTVAKFNDIDWSVTPKFIKTEVLYKSVLLNMGSSRLWSVPYSALAGGLGGSINKLEVSGKTTSLEEALFEVKNKDGQTVFAVYNEGVRVYVDDGAKGKKGGFAIGGFDKAKDGVNQDLFVVNHDSVRFYLDTLSVKGKKGGFAIGGFDPAKKGNGEEYLHVTRDSTRIYVNDNPGKVKKGGFAIGGFSGAKDEINNFLDLTPENYFIGHRSGTSNTSGLYNSFFGYETGVNNTEGSVNTFIGYKAGYSNTIGSYNVFIGDSAAAANTEGYGNVIIGNWAGWKNTTGSRNIIVGVAGYENTTGAGNVMLGTFAGTKNHEGVGNVYVGDYSGANTSGGKGNVFIGLNSAASTLKGERNVFLGSYSGYNVDSANFNVFLGTSSGWASTGGKQNIFIGPFSGYNSTGDGNVFIGNESGYYETSSNKLYISNSATISPLIYGEFDNGMVVVNGNSGNNYYGSNFYVNGTAGGLASWFALSDKKLKQDIVTIPDALQKVLKLRGVNFMWNEPKKGMDGRQMGFIGQEAAEVIPEVVSIKDDHYAMQYAPITALLVEGMKEQQRQLESQQEKIESQQKEIDELKTVINIIISNQTSKDKK